VLITFVFTLPCKV